MLSRGRDLGGDLLGVVDLADVDAVLLIITVITNTYTYIYIYIYNVYTLIFSGATQRDPTPRSRIQQVEHV